MLECARVLFLFICWQENVTKSQVLGVVWLKHIPWILFKFMLKALEFSHLWSSRPVFRNLIQGNN
jgi:hypothetical protein